MVSSNSLLQPKRIARLNLATRLSGRKTLGFSLLQQRSAFIDAESSVLKPLGSFLISAEALLLQQLGSLTSAEVLLLQQLDFLTSAAVLLLQQLGSFLTSAEVLLLQQLGSLTSQLRYYCCNSLHYYHLQWRLDAYAVNEFHGLSQPRHPQLSRCTNRCDWAYNGHKWSQQNIRD